MENIFLQAQNVAKHKFRKSQSDLNTIDIVCNKHILNF